MTDIYCEKILTGLLKVEIVFETELVLAFHHTQAFWEQHVVIISKQHIESLAVYPKDDALSRDFFAAIQYVTQLFAEQYGGCRISSNVGTYQTSKHLHWYVHSGERISGKEPQKINE